VSPIGVLHEISTPIGNPERDAQVVAHLDAGVCEAGLSERLSRSREGQDAACAERGEPRVDEIDQRAEGPGDARLAG
jgi:hypothetical protein